MPIGGGGGIEEYRIEVRKREGGGREENKQRRGENIERYRKLLNYLKYANITLIMTASTQSTHTTT